MVFRETQRGKEAVVRDEAAEAGRGWVVGCKGKEEGGPAGRRRRGVLVHWL